MVRQCAAPPQTYAPPQSAASSVMRVSLDRRGVPVSPHVERRARIGRLEGSGSPMPSSSRCAHFRFSFCPRDSPAGFRDGERFKRENQGP